MMTMMAYKKETEEEKIAGKKEITNTHTHTHIHAELIATPAQGILPHTVIDLTTLYRYKAPVYVCMCLCCLLSISHEMEHQSNPQS